MTLHDSSSASSTPVTQWISPKVLLEQNRGIISKTFLYSAIQQGLVPSKRFGTRKILIPANVLDMLPDNTPKP